MGHGDHLSTCIDRHRFQSAVGVIVQILQACLDINDIESNGVEQPDTGKQESHVQLFLRASRGLQNHVRYAGFQLPIHSDACCPRRLRTSSSLA